MQLASQSFSQQVNRLFPASFRQKSSFPWERLTLLTCGSELQPESNGLVDLSAYPTILMFVVISVVSVVTVVSMLAMVALLMFVMVFVLLFGMLFLFFSMLFSLIRLPVAVILPPVWMVLVSPFGLMVIPPILVVPLVLVFVKSPVAILPRGWLTQRFPILRMTVCPTLEMGML